MIFVQTKNASWLWRCPLAHLRPRVLRLYEVMLRNHQGFSKHTQNYSAFLCQISTLKLHQYCCDIQKRLKSFLLVKIITKIAVQERKIYFPLSKIFNKYAHQQMVEHPCSALWKRENHNWFFEGERMCLSKDVLWHNLLEGWKKCNKLQVKKTSFFTVFSSNSH